MREPLTHDGNDGVLARRSAGQRGVPTFAAQHQSAAIRHISANAEPCAGAEYGLRRIGIHLADATQVGQNYQGKGVNQAARIASVANGSEIVASAETVAGTKYRTSEERTVELKGLSQPVDVVTIEWQ